MLTRPLTIDEAWATVGARLHAMLRRRGVDPDAADDIVQETAARALEHGVEFRDEEDLLRWANVVAWRIALNDWRGRQWIAASPVPDRPATVPLEDEVIARHTLARVLASLSRLSAADREALRFGGEARTRTEATKHYVRRHRARARLAALVEGLVGVLAAVLWRGRPRTRAAAVAVAAPLLIAAVVLLPHEGERGGVAVEEANARDTTIVGPSRPMRGAGLPALHDVRSPLRPGGADPRRGVVLPPFEIVVTDEIRVAGRPKEPDDHLACWDTVVLGVQCVAEPEPVKRLFAD